MLLFFKDCQAFFEMERAGNWKDCYLRIYLLLLFNKNAIGPYNLTSPNPVSNNEFSETIGDVLNRPSFFTVPSFALNFLYGEGAGIVLKGQNVIPKRLIDEGFVFQFPHIKEALIEILNSNN